MLLRETNIKSVLRSAHLSKNEQHNKYPDSIVAWITTALIVISDDYVYMN